MSAPGSEDRQAYIASPYAILTVLALINLINYVDRQILSGMLPFLQKSVDEGGLGLTDTETGLLQSAFMIVHSIASIPLGILADRYLRKKLIAVGVGLWSIATALAGFASTFFQMFVSRAAVGIGEATYAPAATALISDSFSDKARARALGVFQSGMVLGGGLGILLGAVIATHWGWRWAFFLVGVPGLLLVVAALAIAEKPRQAKNLASDQSMRMAAKGMTREMRVVLRAPGVFWVYTAGILITFMVGALQYWGLSFVIRYHYGGDETMSATVGTTFAPVVLGAAFIGVILGSVIADRLEKRFPGRGRMMVVGIGPVLGAPLVAVGLLTSSLTVLYVCLALGTALNTFYAGPVLAVLHDVVGDKAHATATGAYFFLVHFLGDAFSPAIVGWISHETGSLRIGLLVAAAAAVAGGAAALLGLRRTAEAVKMHSGDG